MKQIQLTNGKFATVDEEDYYRVVGYKWVAVRLFADKYYARNQKHGLLSKFLLKSHPNEEFVVDFLNGDTLDYRKENLVKRKSIIRDPNFEIIKKKSQLTFEFHNINSFIREKGKENKGLGVYEKVVYEAKHVDESGRVFHFGTFDNLEEAKVAYERNMKMLAE